MGRLRAGLAEVVITPPVGVRLSGYSARTGASTGVLDDLYAKALVLECDGARIAVVACDLIQVDADLVAAVRARVTDRTGLPAVSVLVAATHTHSGPALDQLDDATLDQLAARIAGAVTAATHTLRDAVVGFASGAADVGANRRFRDSPTGLYFLYNDPVGTMDPTVQVMTIRTPDGQPLGALVNYACHPVTLGDDELQISKDYVHFTCQTLKQAWGHRSVILFLQGCAGNINPRWIWDRPDLKPPPERIFPTELEPRLRETRRLGRVLGGAALAAAESVAHPLAVVELGARTSRVNLPVRSDLPAETRESAAAAARAGAGRRYRNVLHTLAARPATLPGEVQVLRVGPALIVGLPGEIFVEHQIAIRARLGGRPVFVAGVANDCLDYVCTAQAFREGGYEPLVSHVAPEAGELLVESAVSAARDL